MSICLLEITIGDPVSILGGAVLDCSDNVRSKNNHNKTNEKASGEVISPHSHYIFIE